MTRILIGGNCTTGGSPIVGTAESPVPWIMIPRIDVIELTPGGAAQPRGVFQPPSLNEGPNGGTEVVAPTARSLSAV